MTTSPQWSVSIDTGKAHPAASEWSASAPAAEAEGSGIYAGVARIG
ncbi:hypothetical protein ABZ619_10345 [Streptomyces sp. NPDC007851]